VDLGFKAKYLKDVAETVLTYCHHAVAPDKIYIGTGEHVEFM
jgi:hypothetical protein